MSIVTKKGDQGRTTLMYNRQIAKTDLRVEAYGYVDELNSSLGLARATATTDYVRERLLHVQKDLVILMGELATLPEDRPRYIRDGFRQVTPEMTLQVEQLIAEIEPKVARAKGWAMPGNTLHGAALDLARTVARRAERHSCALQQVDTAQNPEIVIYLNRLSDALWLLARWVERPDETASSTAG